MNWPGGFGIWLPCEVCKVRDGDTVEVRIPGSRRIWPIRLLDCWCEPGYTAKGAEATEQLKKHIEGKAGSVFIPAPRSPLRLTRMLTFDRVLAHVYDSEGRSLADIMVQGGYATTSKP